MMKLLGGTLASVLALSALAACSSDTDPDPFQDPTTGDNKKAGECTNSLGGCNPTGTPQPPAELEACATSTIEGKTTPLDIIVALDVSGSMCEGVEQFTNNCNDPQSKWQTTKAALSSFFKDANHQNKETTASIITWAGTSCNGFQTPINPSNVALPDTADTLVKGLNSVNPNGGTPTVAAIRGALAYARQVKASKPDHKVIIALATDGEPTACGSVQQAGQEAAAAKTAGFPVYVIGVGPALTNLATIAQGAGTNQGKPYLVTRNVTTELAKAMQEIRGDALGCSVKLPAAPAGETLDLKKVNLTLKTNDGRNETIGYSQDCSNPGGWKYTPNAQTPDGIEMCDAACAAVKANDKGQLSVVLGCATKAGPTK